MSSRMYFIAHHLPKDYDRCIKLKLFGKEIFICARCFGVFCAIIFSVFLYYFFAIPRAVGLVMLYLFPIPAFVDWGLNIFKISGGTNFSRVITGFFLGFTYSRLFYIIIRNQIDTHLWAVLIIYGTIAFVANFFAPK